MKCEKMQQEVHRRLEFDRTRLLKINEKLQTAFFTNLVREADQLPRLDQSDSLWSFALIERNH